MLLAGCAVPQDPAKTDSLANSPWAIESGVTASNHPGISVSAWKHHTLPGKTATQFNYARKDGRDSIAARAASSASILRQITRIEPAELGNVRFSWKVPELVAEADLALREADDSPVRVILAFEGDRSRFSAKDALLSELARTLTGEEMPYATLMYVWCNKREPGTILKGTRTDRIRRLVVESGTRHLNKWMDYERDIRADYQRAFGEAPGALVGVAIMTDTDNTRSTTSAWYGPVRLGTHATAKP
ncbi:MAG: DUF3047 domain-containing protein [Ramlibacter sp.]